MAKVVDTDNGYKALVERLDMGRPQVEIGIFEGTSDGKQIIDIGTIHEFGLGVPERSFLRAWFDENEDLAKEAMFRLLKQVAQGKIDKTTALERFGLWVQGQVQKRIASGGVTPPLAQSTIDKKGSSVPLIDTGALRSSITYRVKE